MTYHTTIYTFGDLDTTVTFTVDGYASATDPGGITIESVTLADGHDILGSLPERVISDITFCCSEELLAA